MTLEILSHFPSNGQQKTLVALEYATHQAWLTALDEESQQAALEAEVRRAQAQ